MPQEILNAPDDYIRTVRPDTVHYLGPNFSFSYETAQMLFLPKSEPGPYPQLVDHPAFSAVMEALIDQNHHNPHPPTEVAVVPIKNSTNPPIHENLNPLLDADVEVVGEARVQIHLALAGLPGVKVESVKTAASQRAPFNQAKTFVLEHGLDKIVVESTSGAAEMVRTAGDSTVAAICSVRAARNYGLDVIASDIQDGDNITRFFVVKKAGPDEPDIDILRSDALFSAAKKKGHLFTEATIVGLVIPNQRGTAGELDVKTTIYQRHIEIDTISYKDRHPTKNSGDKEWLMSFTGSPRALWNLFREESAYRKFMRFKLLGAFPVASLYDPDKA